MPATRNPIPIEKMLTTPSTMNTTADPINTTLAERRSFTTTEMTAPSAGIAIARIHGSASDKELSSSPSSYFF